MVTFTCPYHAGTMVRRETRKWMSLYVAHFCALSTKEMSAPATFQQKKLNIHFVRGFYFQIKKLNIHFAVWKEANLICLALVGRFECKVQSSAATKDECFSPCFDFKWVNCCNNLLIKNISMYQYTVGNIVNGPIFVLVDIRSWTALYSSWNICQLDYFVYFLGSKKSGRGDVTRMYVSSHISVASWPSNVTLDHEWWVPWFRLITRSAWQAVTWIPICPRL